MTKEKLRRTAAHQRSLMLSITAIAKDEATAEQIRTLLANADLEKVLMKTCPNYFEWLEALPDEPLPGLADACWSWIRHWGNGGGDYSTETQIQEAIDALKSDSPKELADAMYCSVAEYSKSPFEASVLVMDIMRECLAECETKNEEEPK